MPDCPVCCEVLNKSNRNPVECSFNDCNYKACKTCVRQYLLGTTADPHCMKCRKEWSVEFVITNLNRSYWENDYKIHRQKLLTEREVSRLPETAELAENQGFIDEEQKKRAAYQLEMNELKKQMAIIKQKSIESSNTIYNIQNGNLSKERKKFIMSCPNNDCRGYLSTQYKCELCKLFTCSQCHEIIGDSRNGPHICSPDNILSAELIRKDTKPCPCCGVRIFKISGCNQMWCTECKVAFDYATGKIDKGMVHNPEYYRHLAQLRNGEAPRNPGDILCGGLCSWHDLQFKIIRKLPTDYLNDKELMHISMIHRFINHLTHYELVHTRRQVRTLQDLSPLRVDFILKKITKEQFSAQIYRKDNLRKKHNELLHIYEFLSVVGIENFNTLSASKLTKNNFYEEAKLKMKELDRVRCICNEQFCKISKTQNKKVMHVSDTWIVTNKKY